MVNFVKSDTATILNVKNGRIFIWADTMYSGTVRVENHNGTCLWQRTNQDSDCLVKALIIAELGIPTGVFES